ncbi:MAG: hypothetical protein ACP5EQ_06475 [Candidatus Cloacimonadia bacterium]
MASGQKLLHPTLGLGVLLDIEGKGAIEVLLIKFESGEKRLMSSMAHVDIVKD